MCSERCRLRGSTVSWRGDIVPPPEAKSPPSQRPTSTKGQYPRYRRHRLRELDWAFCNTGSRTWLQPHRKRVGLGKSVSVRVAHGGRSIIKKHQKMKTLNE